MEKHKENVDWNSPAPTRNPLFQANALALRAHHNVLVVDIVIKLALPYLVVADLIQAIRTQGTAEVC